MATPFLVSQADITLAVKMVRSFSAILKDTNTYPNKDLLDYLNDHAFPRIRGQLLTATDGTHNHIFYNDLDNLVEPQARSRAEGLLTKVLEEPTIRDSVFRIAAAYAASWAITSTAGQIMESVANAAMRWSKEADADLKILVSSPELSLTAAQAREKLDEIKDDGIPKIYVALDMDPTTFDAAKNTASLYKGAQETGTIRLWVGPYSIEAAITVGDTPVDVMHKLATSLRTSQAQNPVPASINVVLGPNEGSELPASRWITFTDATGKQSRVSPAALVSVGWLSFHAYQYDDQTDALFCTLELLNTQGKFGIKGLLYGGAPSYDLLTASGPHSVFIDLKTSKMGLKNPKLGEGSGGMSDAFYFQVPGNAGKTTTEGAVRYQVANVAVANRSFPRSKQPRTVPVPAGSTAMDVARLIAMDMDKVAFDNKLLPALRSPTQISVMGQPVSAPGLRLVPYRPSGFEDKLVVDILEMHPEVSFGVLPPNLVTNGAFDNNPKSLVLDILFVQQQASKMSPLSTVTGQTILVEGVPSDNMRRALEDINFFNRGVY